MTVDWESKFATWATPPSDTEEKRINNAIRAIRRALDADSKLKPKTKVFVQGSYRNRVNVRQESDVDIGVLYTGNSFYSELPPGTSKVDFDIIDGDTSYSEFKNEVGQALISHFGASAVTRGNKAFDVHENTYRVDCDVVPVLTHRRYSTDGKFICGVELHPDDGGTIVNWPERLYDNSAWPSQHYENGVRKNSSTKRAYKGVVRILKKLQHVMEGNGISAATGVPGFLIECLVWNAPNTAFMHKEWDQDVQAVLTHVWSNTDEKTKCDDWGEVSEFKYLFRGSPDTKRQSAFAFVNAAWDYIGVR